MERLELEVNLREATGKSGARKLRATGAVPAILYGGGKDSLALSVDERALGAVLRRGTNQIIDLKAGDGFDGRLVLLKDYQRDPLSRRVMHCDFYEVDTKQTIDVQVPVLVTGKSKGVEQQGGVLDVVQREVAVKCLPLSIPDSLSISRRSCTSARPASRKSPRWKRRPRLSRVWPSRARPPRMARPSPRPRARGARATSAPCWPCG
jgi:large subunit ribosomal protein L25